MNFMKVVIVTLVTTLLLAVAAVAAYNLGPQDVTTTFTYTSNQTYYYATSICDDGYLRLKYYEDGEWHIQSSHRGSGTGTYFEDRWYHWKMDSYNGYGTIDTKSCSVYQNCNYTK